MIYRLSDDRANYLVMEIPPQELQAKMGNDPRPYYGTLTQGASDYWVQPNITFIREDAHQKNFDVPDITIWTSNLALNGKAYESLKNALDPFGEFLPLNCEGLDYYLFNVMTFESDFDALDKEGSEWAIFDGVKSHLNKLAFKEDKLERVLLFRSQYEGCNRIFCGEAFKTLIQRSGLNGLLFKTALEEFS